MAGAPPRSGRPARFEAGLRLGQSESGGPIADAAPLPAPAVAPEAVTIAAARVDDLLLRAVLAFRSQNTPRRNDRMLSSGNSVVMRG
jgi:hypothetical protein